jgi:threonine/homoserine/homoserine lactone efflux protein
MIETSSLLLFMAAGLMLNLTPGPDMLYVATRSVNQGQKAGVVSALGIGAGSIVHCLAAAFGISAVLMYSATAFMIVKFAGAAYLIYLGIKTLFTKQNALGAQTLEPVSLQKMFWQGVITNILNPKVALFFLAFLPQFVNVEKGNTALQILFLGTIFNISGTTVNMLVGLFFGYTGQRLMSNPKIAIIQRWVTGSVFLALGARLAFAERK